MSAIMSHESDSKRVVGRASETIPEHCERAACSVAALVTHVPQSLHEVERSHIERTLRAHSGNRTQSARELGICRATLIKKIRAYGL